jgi:hypothetical protein
MKEDISIIATAIVLAFALVCGNAVRVAMKSNSATALPIAAVASIHIENVGSIGDADNAVYASNIGIDGSVGDASTNAVTNVEKAVNVNANNSANVINVAEAQANPTPAVGPQPGSIKGWAWSSNIGWIKLDGINVDASGNLSGYAWSSNIGWIKFGGLSNYPTGGAAGAPAKIDMASGKVTGWSRFCAGTANGDCSSMTSRTDGWDGWVELSGANHPTNASGDAGSAITSGVKMDAKTGHITGMAWGGEVVGWLNFNAILGVGATTTTPPCNGQPVNPDGSCPPGGGVPPGGGTPTNPLSGSILQDGTLYIGSTGPTANTSNIAIRQGQTFGLRWKNTHDSTYTCTASAVSPDSKSFKDWAGGSNVPAGADKNRTYSSTDTTKAPIGNYSFKIACDNGSAASHDEDTVTLKISSGGVEWEH